MQSRVNAADGMYIHASQQTKAVKGNDGSLSAVCRASAWYRSWTADIWKYKGLSDSNENVATSNLSLCMQKISHLPYNQDLHPEACRPICYVSGCTAI